PKAVRAVGQATRANELAIIVPCHRIVGKNGALVGYAGSRTDVKAKLLELERRYQSRFS
ncbi:methylated-DNA--[protein]-cysteine S-methyltransferase, partial [Geobacillus stearothermophilus]|uniref:methylated-DNA--[protein]-cysteine S-methyltransferase n=1 Tax=Geobacillus stearothermophilus TaxID=1422 RepID=UPI002E24AAF9|nr:methylated-DNA--[protein]-cysteine S-methyltransferase [Geobacillus stearothermophilus]